MTDHDIQISLDALTRSVNSHRTELGERIASVETNIKGLKENLNKFKVDVKEDIAKCEKKTSDNRIWVEGELDKFRVRGDATGQTDPQRGGQALQHGNGAFKTILPYLWKGAAILGLSIGVGLGMKLVGADSEEQAATQNMVRYVTDTLLKVQREVKEIKQNGEPQAMDSRPQHQDDVLGALGMGLEE